MSKRRFIAGAVCPACKQQDKLVVYIENDAKYFECVKCGHKEREPEPQTVAPTAPVKSIVKEQVLTFVPMPKK